MYDLEKNDSLNAYRFVFWGKALVDQQQTNLFTRDGQRWLLEFDRLQGQFRVQLIEQYDSDKREEWIWKFCQYVDGQEICSKEWMTLSDKASIELEFLI